MTDDARRRAERRAARDGDLGAAAQDLAQRLRAGAITRERLALAAYAGDPAARAALGRVAPPTPRDPGRFVRGLARVAPGAVDQALATLMGLAPGAADDWPDLHAWRVEAHRLAHAGADADDLRAHAARFRWHGQDEAMSFGARVAEALVALGTPGATEAAARLARAAVKRLGEESVRRALRADLTAWALDG